jgi:hypothetical protein
MIGNSKNKFQNKFQLLSSIYVRIHNKTDKKSLIILNNEGGCEGSTFTEVTMFVCMSDILK